MDSSLVSFRCAVLVARTLALLALVGPLTAQVQSYLIDHSGDRLLAIDLTTAATEQHADLRNDQLSFAHDMTWRADTQEIWVVEYQSAAGAMGVLDPVQARFQLRFQLPIAGYWTAIAWDPSSAMFYLAQQQSNRTSLFAVDPATGGAILIGDTGLPFVDSLDVDGAGMLWGVQGDQLYWFDKVTSHAHLVSATGTPVAALAIDRYSGVFYVLGLDGNQRATLYTLDPGRGSLSSRGQLSVFGARAFDLVDGTCHGAFQPYGAGCPGSGGIVPTLDVYGCLGDGGTIVVRVLDAMTGTNAIGLFGLMPGAFPLGNGCTLLLDPPLASPNLFLPIFGTGGPGRGFASLPLNVPPGLPPASFTLQAFLLDPGAMGSFASTNGVRIEVF